MFSVFFPNLSNTFISYQIWKTKVETEADHLFLPILCLWDRVGKCFFLFPSKAAVNVEIQEMTTIPRDRYYQALIWEGERVRKRWIKKKEDREEELYKEKYRKVGSWRETDSQRDIVRDKQRERKREREREREGGNKIPHPISHFI